MRAAKISITLARGQLASARAAVRAGRAASVSSYIAQALDRQAREDSLDAPVRDLIAAHGRPSVENRAWGRRVLKRGKRE
jgi:hypothetical protein